ncbi:PREDICTED: probable protein arginine N-methyltransferase 6 [Papilio xuthus]|uniref:type I protein arginine methyltransferase n=1 Tax=Papilio xuthus TaxID=66420 RepID=A0AAJ6Z1F3_PAPXU|nr:PREDICTED: probable protein arginine N-methyltransferase 6 [Papilio xuthus]
MDSDQDYFTSYEDLEIHRLMLEDYSRTETYRKAIHEHKECFKNKIVMDVGCGTGILSVFCAQAGAKKVYAVEASNIANIAKDVVKENNFEEVIEVIQNEVENVVLPNNEKVDIIVSEWMGFYLLHEGMLDSVLVARDKFLKEDGQMFPESAAIYVAPCSVPSLYHKWDSFHGVSMFTFAKLLRMDKSKKPEIMQIQPEDLLGTEILLACINLKDVQISELDSLEIQHVVGVNKAGKYQGLCLWFDCTFPVFSENCKPVVLSTSPHSPQTHWKQTVILFPEEREVEESEPLAFKLSMSRDIINNRRYNLHVELLDPETIDHPIPCSCDMSKCILIKMLMLQHAGQTGDEKSTTEEILEDEVIDDS